MKRLQLFATNRPLDVVLYWRKDGQLLLDPPYQRGDVWGPVRQQNLIKSFLQGIPIPAIIVNDRSRTSKEFVYAVIDGKQRLTAFLKFLDGELQVPAEWFGLDGLMVSWNDLSLAQQRGFRQTPLPFAEGSLQVEQEIEVFELVNYGGVPQGESDLPE